MRARRRCSLLALATALGAQEPAARAGAAAPADSIALWDGLGDHHHPITTRSALSQRYFDQGLRFVYAFDHPDAIRSFRLAQRIDPTCAMCSWGRRSRSGRTSTSRWIPPRASPRTPRSAARSRSPRTRRRASAPTSRRSPRATAPIPRRGGRRSTRRIRGRWRVSIAPIRRTTTRPCCTPSRRCCSVRGTTGCRAGAPSRTARARSRRSRPSCAARRGMPARVTSTSMRSRRHTRSAPSRAPSGCRRSCRARGTSSTCPRTSTSASGRYADAIERNVHALHADEPHIAEMPADGVYRLALHPHNAHFLSFAASMIGRSAQALDAAAQTRAKTDTAMLRAPGLGALQHYYMMPLLANVRFGRWDAVLAEPEPAEDLPYPRALRHYARALARIASGRRRRRRGGARVTAPAARRRAAEGGDDLGPQHRGVAARHRAGLGGGRARRGAERLDCGRHRAAPCRGDGRRAHLRRAAPLASAPRQQLGAVLLRAGRAAEAERVFRQDLERHPENGWSLAGLAGSLRAQGKLAEAARVETRFRRAWATADVPPPVIRGPDVERALRLRRRRHRLVVALALAHPLVHRLHHLGAAEQEAAAVRAASSGTRPPSRRAGASATRPKKSANIPAERWQHGILHPGVRRRLAPVR